MDRKVSLCGCEGSRIANEPFLHLSTQSFTKASGSTRAERTNDRADKRPTNARITLTDIYSYCYKLSSPNYRYAPARASSLLDNFVLHWSGSPSAKSFDDIYFYSVPLTSAEQLCFGSSWLRTRNKVGRIYGSTKILINVMQYNLLQFPSSLRIFLSFSTVNLTSRFVFCFWRFWM